jgi:hypothetical protein
LKYWKKRNVEPVDLVIPGKNKENEEQVYNIYCSCFNAGFRLRNGKKGS